MRIYTAGHSNHPLQAFVGLLADSGIADLVDVRANPGSRRNPQFNRERLRDALAGAAIRYHWAGKHLGGLRKASADSDHRALPPAMQGYAEHMQSEAFAGALRALRELAGPVAIMCAEGDPAHCHRSLIADYLLSIGDRVTHLIGGAGNREHRLHPAARRGASGLVYDRQTQARLDFD